MRILKPCPVCGWSAQTALRDGDNRHYIFCLRCGKRGRSARFKLIAAFRWNRDAKVKKGRKHIYGREF